MNPSVTSKKIKSDLEKISNSEFSVTDKLKQVGKLVAEDMENVVMIAFGPHSVYYTGLSGLFSQPEFRDINQTINVSEMFDRAEELIESVFDRVTEKESTTLIGSANPLGNFSSLIATRLPNDCLFMIMGPLRMDYRRGSGIMHSILELYT
jgi:transcriptional regulator of heat shock response